MQPSQFVVGAFLFAFVTLADADSIAPKPRPASAPPLVAFLGDSLSAGLGVAAREAFPAVAERLMRETGTPFQLLNAGVSGDTTAGGRARLRWILMQKPHVVVIELGGNDGLRGKPLDLIESNLRDIVAGVRNSGAAPILLEMAIPLSYGPDYVNGFVALYAKIADDLDVPLVRQFLVGVGGVRELNQPDGIHPTPAGHERLAKNIIPVLTEVLTEMPAER